MDQGKENEDENFDAAVDEILADDEEFQQDIAGISEGLSGVEVADLSAEDTGLNFDDSTKGPDPQLKEDAPNFVKKFHTKVVVPFKNFKARAVIRFQNLHYAFLQNMSAAYAASKLFFRQSLPDFFKYLKSQTVTLIGLLSAQWNKFWSMSRAQKVAIASMFILTVSALTFLSLSFKSGWLSRYVHTLPTSYKSAGHKLGEVSSKSETVAFSIAFPDSEYQVKLKRVVVNLKADSYSGSLPMGAFDFYLGLDSQDTAIEIKDREDEVLDRVQRALESMSYTEVMSDTGKLKMKARIRDSINEMLNQGRVVGVYINTMITNH